jgi:DNA repair exonuclease SbcCD nuclease subunit
MRILIVGDQHFRYELPYASAFSDGRQKEWEAVKLEILKASEDCDAIVLMGDNFNARHNHSSVIREFIYFLNDFCDKEVHIIVGNHERYGTSSALDFLKEINRKNWFIYTEPKLTAVGNTPAMMIPYMTPALLGVETKEEALKILFKKFPKDKTPLAFVHHGITDATIRGLPMDFVNEIILPRDKMEKYFDHIFAGHIHHKQQLSPITYMTGDIFSTQIGDYEKSVWIYESTKKGETVTEVPMPVRGIYKMVWEQKRTKIPKHSIVKCYVTDRKTDLDEVRKYLKTFDASLIVEQYPSLRTKIHFEEGGLDLSVDSLLKLYAEAKKLDYGDLKEGFELIKQ